MAKTAAIAVRTNAFPVMKMKVPDHLLSRKRTDYGWEDLKDKGDFKKFPRLKADNAKSSAHSYAKAHGFSVRSMAVTDDETGLPIRENVYFDLKDNEVSISDIPVEVQDDPKKFAKQYTMQELPVEYIIVRVTGKDEPAID